MITKELLFSALGSLTAHSALFVGLGWHVPAQFSVPSAPTSMELLLSAGKGEVIEEPLNVIAMRAKLDEAISVEITSEIALSPSPSAQAPRNDIKSEAKPIEGTDIGSLHIGSPLKTHGACIAENPPPLYPRAARRLGLEGKTHLQVQITPKGKPAQVSILSSSGHSILDNAAVKAVQKWVFIPAKQFGTPIKSQLTIPVVFNIKD